MSVQAMSWVLDNSKSHLAARLVLLSIANHADAYGNQAWPSVAKIAQEAHVSIRQTQRAIVELCQLGELAVSVKAGPSQWNLYRVLMGGDNLSPPVVTNRTQGGDIFDGAIRKNRPEPSKPTPPTPPKRGGARLTDRVRRKINLEIQKKAGAWDGLRAFERDERIDSLVRGFGIDPEEFRAAEEWPRSPRPEYADNPTSQEATT
jgi:Helix-turn-helix domain